MASFVALSPPRGGPEERREKTVLVRDGFAWLAFLFGPLWLLWHRLWMEALVLFGLELAIGVASRQLGWNGTGAALSLLLSLLVGFEASALRVRALLRRGYAEAGVVVAGSASEAEIRLWSERDEGVADPVPPSSFALYPSRTPRPARPALGLFTYPGRP